MIMVPLVWSGGTDGVISPHATIFAYAPEGRYEPTDEPRVTVGYAMSEVLLGGVGEDRRVRADHPVGAAGPHERDLGDLLRGARPLLLEHRAVGMGGDDPGVVVDSAVALSLADHGDDVVGRENSLVDEGGEAGGVADTLDRDLAYFDGAGHGPTFQGCR